METPVPESAEPKRGWWHWLIGAGRKSQQPIKMPEPMPSQRTNASAQPAETPSSAAIRGKALPASTAGTSAKPKLSLASKLADAATVDLSEDGKENTDEPELTAEAEDDDPGELTRSIL